MALKIDDTFEGKVTLIELGEAPDDKRGDVAQVFCAKYNGSLRALMFFLTGGAKLEGKLDKPLPIASGGTGSNSVQGMLSNMGIVIGYNGKLHKGAHQLKVWNDKVYYNGKADPDIYIEKQGTGLYLIKGITRVPVASSNGAEFSIIHPEDGHGRTTHSVSINNVSEEGLLIEVRSYDYVNGEGSLADLPKDIFTIINAAKV